MGRNETPDAAAGRARVAELVDGDSTVLVLGAEPDALAEELRARGREVTALTAPSGSGTFDVVVLDEGALSAAGDPAELLTTAAERVAPRGRLVVVSAQSALALTVQEDAAAPAADEVAELRHRLLTQRDHVIGLEATTATARAQAARAQREAQQQLEEMAASATWRAGRLAVKPASWVRSRLTGRR
ncbi:hypothetical protein AA0Y32_01010 [Georgenia phoenicis]|uniref:hypothetical protein n=1 Tax=unclassified Georgenia TaxID=2626815 RepID=UPI0039B11040